MQQSVKKDYPYADSSKELMANIQKNIGVKNMFDQGVKSKIERYTMQNHTGVAANDNKEVKDKLLKDNIKLGYQNPEESRNASSMLNQYGSNGNSGKSQL